MADSDNERPSSERRSADFVERYANNVQFEPSVWDLKLLLGTLDQSTTPHSTNLHTTVNIPWAAVKLMAYYIRLNVLFHESQNGKINIPERVLPVPIEESLPDLANGPGGLELLKKLQAMRAELL